MEQSYFWNKVKLALPVILLLMVFSSCTIVRHDQGKNAQKAKNSASSSGSASFDAQQYVLGIWDDKIVPELTDNAMDLKFIIDGLKADRVEFEKKYGRRQEETSSYNYIVKGTYSVKSVLTASAAGVLELNLKDVSGKNDVQIQIGPVVKGSTVRDVLPFVRFGDFENQIQFAGVSREINIYIRNHILKSLDTKDLVGKNIDFIGAFTWNNDGSVTITPISISRKGS